MTIQQPLHQSSCRIESEDSNQLHMKCPPPSQEWKYQPKSHCVRLRSTRRCPFYHPLLLLLALSLFAAPSTEAKLAFRKRPSESTGVDASSSTGTTKRRRWVRKNVDNQKKNDDSQKKNDNYHVRHKVSIDSHSNNKTKLRNAKTILQPRPKRAMPKTPPPPQQEQEQEQKQPIDLKVTLTKNESGEHVLVLTPESVIAVQKEIKGVENDAISNTPETVPTITKKTAVLKESEPLLESPQILFYDPEELPITKAGDPPPVPPRVYDQEGNQVELDDGEVDIIRPKHPSKDQNEIIEEEEEDSTTSSTSSNSTSTTIKIRPQTQDQMIIISTVATMALLVGALSARRLRSRQFLSFCIENESLEDDLAFDAAYTTQSTVGASSLYGGYDTFGDGERYGGDLRWRGDLEKFDV